MEYTAANYLGPLLIVSAGYLVLAGIFCVWLGRWLSRKTGQVWAAFAPLAVYALILALLGRWAVPVLEQTGDILIPGEYQMRSTAGRIGQIVSAEYSPVHYADGGFCGGAYVTVDGQTYYVISDDSLSEGMLVELRYAQFEYNVILGWREVTPEQAAQILADADKAAQTDTPSATVPPEQQTLGLWLTRLGFWGFAISAVLMYLANKRLAVWLLARDAAVRGHIVPNRFVMVFMLMPLGLLAMVIAGTAIQSGKGGSLLILAIGGTPMAAAILADQCTRLMIDGRTLTLRRLGREKHYRVTDIYSISWKHCRGVTGKALVIVFCDGKSVWFMQDFFLGVQNTYIKLTNELNKIKEV